MGDSGKKVLKFGILLATVGVIGIAVYYGPSLIKGIRSGKEKKEKKEENG